jgi:hypothetical protein
MSRTLQLTFLGALSLSMAGCELVGGIFRIGVWAGVIMVVLVVLAIWAVVRLLF